MFDGIWVRGHKLKCLYGFGFMTVVNRDKASMRMILRAPAAKVVSVERGGVLPKVC